VVTESDGAAILARTPSACVAHRAPSSTPTLRDVLAGADPPVAVLLTNRCQ